MSSKGKVHLIEKEREMLNEEWIDPVQALKDDPYVFCVGKFWVALKLYGGVELCRYEWQQGRYEWQQGRSPDKFISETGRVYILSEIDAVMICNKPKHPTYNETSY